MPNYNEIVADLREEAERTAEMRASLDRKYEQIIRAIEAVETLAEQSDDPVLELPQLTSAEEQGFTDQVRAIFRANPSNALTAIGIRNLLILRDPTIDSKITLIHTHNTLKRLVKQEEIVETQLPEGRTGYRIKLKPVIDLMAALKKSLAQMEGKKIPHARSISVSAIAETEEEEEEEGND